MTNQGCTRRSFLSGTGSALGIAYQSRNTGAEQRIETRYRYELLPAESGRIRIQLRLDIPSSVTEFEYVFGREVSIEEVEGFTPVGERSLRWNQEARSPTVTYTVDVNQKHRGSFSTYASSSWGLFYKYAPGFEVQYRCDCGSLNPDYEFDFSGPGFVGNELVLLGSRSEVTRHSLGGQTLTIVVPEVSNSRHSPAEIADTLSGAASELSVGSRDPLNMFVVPDPLKGGYTPGDGKDADDMWVHEVAAIDSPENSWVHEYVHTRQEFETSRETRWLIEAIPEYYAAFLTWKQNRISYSTFATHLRTDEGANARLTKPSTWQANAADYTKGRRVIGALDAKIRRQTNGQASFEDVFRRLNALARKATNDDFTQIVAEVADRDVAQWLDRYVRLPEVPEIPRTASDFDGQGSEPDKGNQQESNEEPTTDAVAESVKGVKVSSPRCEVVEFVNPSDSPVTFNYLDEFLEVGPGQTKRVKLPEEEVPTSLRVQASKGEPSDWAKKLVEINGESWVVEIHVSEC